MSLVEHLRTRLLANVRAHAFARVTQALVGIFLTPFVLHRLGQDGYGLWAWLLALTGYFSLTDLGLSQGNVNSLTRALGEGDVARASEVVSATISFYLAMLALAAVVALGLASTLLRLAPPNAPADTFAVFFVLLLALGALVSGYPFGSLLSALQRLDVVQNVDTGRTLLQAIGTLAVLQAGFGLYGLAVLQLTLAVLQTVVRGWACARFLPGLRPRWPRAAEVPALLTTGLPLVLLATVGMLALSYERVVLGFYTSLASLAQYAVAARLVLLVREVPQVLLYSLVPTSAALDVAGDEAALRRLYLRALKVAATLVFPSIVMIYASGPLLLRGWLGSGFEDAAKLSLPLAIAFFVPILSAPGVYILTGRSRLDRVRGVYGAWGIALAVGNWAWIASLGFRGAGWGTAILDVAGTVALLVTIHRREMPIGSEGTRLLGRAALGAVIAALPALLVLRAASALMNLDSRPGSLVAAAATNAVLWGTFSLWAYASGFIRAEEASALREALPAFGRRRDSSADPSHRSTPARAPRTAD